MKILADRHHSGLTGSLILLFEKRLGYELYFQKGLEWYPEYWMVYPYIDTAKQYLERELEGVNGVTLEEFKNIKFDILLCSIPQHVDMWITLRDKYQPQAKLIFQVGNMWAFDNSFPIKNIMASAVIPSLPEFNTVSYHQEFDLNIFYPSPVINTKKIYSFINCLNVVDLYKKDWELFLELERLMTDWEFRSFGGQCRDGAIAPISVVADKMREATFIFQCKTDGDGYGHVIHQTAAIGKPLIIRRSDYRDKLAEALMYEGANIEVDNKTPQQIVEDIESQFKYDGQPYQTKCFQIRNNFNNAVDFDKEEQQIRQFLNNLV